MGKRRRPLSHIDTNSVDVSSIHIDGVKINLESLDDPDVICKVDKPRLMEEFKIRKCLVRVVRIKIPLDTTEINFKAASEPDTRALSMGSEEASVEVMKRKFGLKEIKIQLPDVMQPIFHYQSVQLIAFARNFASFGIIIKCLVSCKFERRYKSFNALRKDVNQHFLDAHADNMNWSGFCSKCQRYVHSSERELTVADEIEHIIGSHTKPNQKKEPAAE